MFLAQVVVAEIRRRLDRIIGILPDSHRRLKCETNCNCSTSSTGGEFGKYTSFQRSSGGVELGGCHRCYRRFRETSHVGFTDLCGWR